MNARRDKGLWIIGILTILLVAVITFSTSTTVWIIPGLPFLLFLTGCILIASLHSEEASLNGVERLVPSFGLSIAAMSLMGFILNYFHWRTRLYSILIALAVFILAILILVWSARGSLIRKQDSWLHLIYDCLFCEGRA